MPSKTGLLFDYVVYEQYIAIMQYMKVIIELGYRCSAIEQARRDLAMSQAGADIDYHLVFESARALFSELTPARIDTLDYLRLHGPMSIYALAKALKRNYSNVHADVEKLLEHGLAEKDSDSRISAPWDAIEIRMAQAKAAHLHADKRVIITPIRDEVHTLEQRLASFDPERHGGETMSTDETIGAEQW